MVVSGDVIVNGLFQCFDASEAVAPDAIGGDIAEPALHHIEPGTGGGDEVNVEAGMLRKPRLDLGMLVRAEVVGDQMQIKIRRGLLINEPQELQPFLMSMPFHAGPDQLAAGHLHRREQRRRAMPPVVVRHRPATTLLERQARLGAIQGLNLALLVHTEHDGVLGRKQVQAHHVDQFLNEPLVFAKLERANPMRGQFMGLPDAMHHRLVNAQMFCKRPHAPVGGVLGFGVKGDFDDRSAPMLALGRLTPTTRSLPLDARKTLGRKALPPLRDRGSIQSEFFGDLFVLTTGRRQKNDLRPCHTARRRSSTARQCRQRRLLLIRQLNGNRSSHVCNPPSNRMTRQTNKCLYNYETLH